MAHNSAGPKQDIVVPAFPREGKKYRIDAEGAEKATGFLADSVDEYAEALQFIFSHEDQLEGIRMNGRERSKMFSTEKFVKTFKEKLISMLNWRVCFSHFEKSGEIELGRIRIGRFAGYSGINKGIGTIPYTYIGFGKERKHNMQKWIHLLWNFKPSL